MHHQESATQLPGHRQNRALRIKENILVPFAYYFLILFISYTSMNKLLAVESFQTNLLKTGLFSNRMTVYLSYFVLATEFIVLALLLFYKQIGALALLVMLCLFTIYIMLLNIYGRYEVCGCGGILNGLEFRYHLYINIGLILLAFVLVEDNFKKNNNENQH